jgi:hypothetical protein
MHTKPRNAVIFKVYSANQNIGAIVRFEVLMAVTKG